MKSVPAFAGLALTFVASVLYAASAGESVSVEIVAVCLSLLGIWLSISALAPRFQRPFPWAVVYSVVVGSGTAVSVVAVEVFGAFGKVTPNSLGAFAIALPLLAAAVLFVVWVKRDNSGRIRWWP